MNLKEIITDLEFISKIPKGYKPNFSDKSLVDTADWFSTIKRRYKGEQGERGVIYVNSLLTQIENSSDISTLQSHLLLAKIGLENLAYTYRIDQQIQVSNDYLMCCEKINKLIKRRNFFSYNPKML